MNLPLPRLVPVSALCLLGGVGLLGAAPESAAEVQAVRAATEAVEERIGELQAALAEARRDLASLEAEFTRYRDHYRTRARLQAVGDQFEMLACLDGREFRNVTIRKVDAIGLSIRHRDGATRINYTALPREWQERLQWNVREAQNARAGEAERRAESDRLTRIAYQRLEERRKEAAEEQREAEERRLLAMKSTPVTASGGSSSRLSSLGRLGERRMVGSGSYDRYGRYYGRYDRGYSSRYYRRPTIYYYPCRTNYRPSSRPCPTSRPTPARQQQRRVWNKIPSRSTITPIRVPTRTGC